MKHGTINIGHFFPQAVEFLAEWSLCPDNVAFLRIQTGIFDPSLIGDKAKWFCRYLSPIQFRTYEEKTTLAAAIQFYNQEHSKAFSPELSPTYDSVSSEPDDLDSYYNYQLPDASDAKEKAPVRDGKYWFNHDLINPFVID